MRSRSDSDDQLLKMRVKRSRNTKPSARPFPFSTITRVALSVRRGESLVTLTFPSPSTIDPLTYPTQPQPLITSTSQTGRPGTARPFAQPIVAVFYRPTPNTIPSSFSVPPSSQRAPITVRTPPQSGSAAPGPSFGAPQEAPVVATRRHQSLQFLATYRPPISTPFASYSFAAARPAVRPRPTTLLDDKVIPAATDGGRQPKLGWNGGQSEAPADLKRGKTGSVCTAARKLRGVLLPRTPVPREFSRSSPRGLSIYTILRQCTIVYAAMATSFRPLRFALLWYGSVVAESASRTDPCLGGDDDAEWRPTPFEAPGATAGTAARRYLLPFDLDGVRVGQAHWMRVTMRGTVAAVDDIGDDGVPYAASGSAHVLIRRNRSSQVSLRCSQWYFVLEGLFGPAPARLCVTSWVRGSVGGGMHDTDYDCPASVRLCNVHGERIRKAAESFYEKIKYLFLRSKSVARIALHEMGARERLQCCVGSDISTHPAQSLCSCPMFLPAARGFDYTVW
ncbi:hypothetical protein BJ912DRAFT_1050471 [Pholiota molesta]|nr:hypothetical protein BJ912DRAFT_1050471 [Pholiota molesta]